MGCIIKLKGKEEYITFESEAEAKEYIKKNHAKIASDLRTSKHGTPSEYLTYQTDQEQVESIIKESSRRAYEVTKENLVKMKMNGWDSETYSRESDAFAISTFLSDLTIEGKRLFPEYITNNYLNVLIQNYICEYFLHSTKEDYTREDIDKLRREVFDNTLPDKAADAKLKTASEWLAYFNSKNKDGKLTIDSDTLSQFDENAQLENDKNFEAMLRGEIIHKIFEDVCLDKSIDTIKSNIEKLVADDGEFLKKYRNETEVRDANVVIQKVKSTLDSKLDGYIAQCQAVKKQILSVFKNKGKEIKLLSEMRLTASLNEKITIKDLTKDKIRGKLDLIVLVDGVPHIIDLKVSHNPIENWHFEKTLKTRYQLASYYRMLNRIGINTSKTTTHVLGLTLNDNGEIDSRFTSFEDWTTQVVHNATINNNLERIFDIIKREPIMDQSFGDRISEYTKTLFGDGSYKTQKQYTEEYFYESLKQDVVEKDGKYTIRYSVFESDGKSHWYHETVDKKDLEDALHRIAKKVFYASENRFSIVFEQFVSDVESYINGWKDIDEFECAKDNRNMVAYLKGFLLKYKNTQYELIHPEISSKFSSIFIKTPFGIEVIKCTHLDPHSSWDIGKKDVKLFNFEGIAATNLKKTVGNVQIASTLLVLNELIGGTNEKIGDIMVVPLNSRKGYKCTIKALKEITGIMHDVLDMEHQNHVRHIEENTFVDPLQSVMTSFTAFLDDAGKFRSKQLVTKSMTEHDGTGIFKAMQDKKSLSFLTEDFDTYTVKDKLEALKMLKNSLMENFADYFENTDGSIIVDEVTALRYMIETAISIYENREFVVEKDISKYGLSKGFYLASMDLIPEENIQTVNRIVQIGFDRVRTRFQKQRLTLKSKLDTFKKGNDYGSFRQYGLGDVSKNYFNLFERTIDGKLVDGDLKFRNPWTDNQLNDHERDFIKYVLFVLNRKKYRLKSFSDLTPSKLKPEDYYCPLMRTKGLDRFRDPNGGVNFPFFTKKYVNEMLNRSRNVWQDTGQLLEGQIEERTKASDLLNSMYNEFNSRTDLEKRLEYIDSAGGIESFTMDVETILDSFFLAEDMEEIFELDVLPKVQSIMFVSVYQANLTDLKLPDFQSFVKEYMKSAVYGDSIVNPEAKKFFKVMGPIRSAGAAIALSYNVTNLPRELLMGFFTNISRAMFNSYGVETFSVKDYMNAFGILLGDVPNFVHNVTKIELLNELYGMSNMSINEIPEQVTSNKTGIFALGGRFSTWTITAPDYWNRMSMFIAQMIHDGCWDAYTLEEKDGVLELVYDMSKDKRFDLYAEYKGDFEAFRKTNPSTEMKEKFNQQAALYKIMRDDLNNELEADQRIDTKKYQPLPRAYTNLQRNSMKSCADIAFGYYDRETKAHFFKTSIGLTFKQFMAYMSAKKMQYFQVRSNTTSRGSYKQLEDAKGNKIWSVYLPNNEIRIVTDEILNTELAEYKDYAQPKMAWTGTYMEGIFQSYMHLFHDLGIGTYEALKGDGTDTLKKLWKEYGKKGDIRHSNMLQGLWDLLLGIIMPWLLMMVLFDDPEESGKSIKKQKGEMGVLGQNAYYIADTALKDFNIFSAMTRFFFEWEAPSFSILQNSFRQFWSAFGDEDLTLAEEFLKGATRSVGAFKFWRPVVDNVINN